MKDCFYKAIVFFCLVLAGQSGRGQSIGNDLVFEHITRKQGLVDNFANVIFQDRRGFLWLGSNHGLSRYDDRNFKNYATLGKKGITDLVIQTIAEDKKGNIWFGTENGLNKLDPFTEIITQYQEASGPGTIPYHWCNYIYRDKDDDLWLSTEKGLALYNEHTDSFQNFPVTVFGKDDRINKFINKIVEDSTGKLWLSTSYGIKAFDKKTKTYTTYLQDEITWKGVFYSLFIDHQGTIWAGAFSDGLFKFNPTAGRFEGVRLDGIDRITFTIADIAEIKMQDSWYLLLATYGGLVSFKQGVKEGSDLSYSLAGYSLSKIFADRQHTLWVAAWQGLFKLNPNSFAFKWIPVGRNGKEAPQVFHIIPAVKNPGTVFYLTSTVGWYEYNIATHAITPHLLPAGKEQLLNSINRWISDDRGYWFTSVQGLGYYDVTNNKLLDLTHIVIAASAQKTTGYIVKATNKHFWITMKRSGILVFDPVTKKDTVLFGDKNKPDNTYGSGISDMQKSPDGNVWFTSGNKLYRVDPYNFSYKIFLAPAPDEKVDETKISPTRMLFTKNGRLLVCSRLRIYEFKNDKLVTVYPLKGFSHFTIEGITEDPEDNLWVRAEVGVLKTDNNFSHWEAMDKLPGWDDATVISEINTTKKGVILFAANAKIGVLKEDLLQKTMAPLPVFISR
ncbi:MAG TPA: two-component regulator propeller domain-containing protein, partial [Ferruginibacter sp.]|nr:two-component regulator propeller domain-containing protein [Ferruginibacter sp.]